MKNLFGLTICFAIACLIFSEPAFSGPGGKIASAVYSTFWGKVLLAILTIIFLPLIIYYMFHEKMAERRARKDLRFMAAYSATFDWFHRQDLKG